VKRRSSYGIACKNEPLLLSAANSCRQSFVLCINNEYKEYKEQKAESPSMSSSAWKTFDLKKLKEKVQGNEPRFFEFLRSRQLSCAMYRLPVGARDMQAPHLEDEVYVVTEGRARLRIDGVEQDVGPGTVLFVSATTDHSFFDITEDLTLLAVFGPATSLR